MRGQNDNSVPADVENIPEREAEWIEQIAKLTTQLQDKRKGHKEQKGEVLRGVHPKSHGCLEAEFIIDDGIAEDLRVGLFANPGRCYSAVIRYSNAAVIKAPDLDKAGGPNGRNGSRGMAIKVLGVDGPVLLEDDGESNQDFLMVNTPEFAFANVRDYLRLTRALAIDPAGIDPAAYFLPLALMKDGHLNPDGTLKPEAEGPQVEMFRKLSHIFGDFNGADLAGTLRSFEVVKAIKAEPVWNPIEVRYFSAAPFRLGNDRVMRYSVEPEFGAVAQEPITDEAANELSDNFLAEALKKSVTSGDEIRLKMSLQVIDVAEINDDKLIESATEPWKGSWTPVATLVVKPVAPDQDLVDVCKPRQFTPWHALPAHEPLGGINRLRKPVYTNSGQHRGCPGMTR